MVEPYAMWSTSFELNIYVIPMKKNQPKSFWIMIISYKKVYSFNIAMVDM